MSRELAALLFLALCAAEFALRIAERWDRAVTWLCPCEGHTT